jgi:hypothetical protein
MSSIHLGQRFGYAGINTPYRFQSRDFLRHVYVLGKTGMGKSTLLQVFIDGLIRSGSGLCVLDPHGDLAEWVLDIVPSHRLEDAIYLDFADAKFAPSLNLVSSAIPEPSRPRVASALVAAFRHIWAESWGPRLEYILYHALRILLDFENASLVALPRLLTDGNFRASAVRQCRDPFVRAFWISEFESWDKRFRTEAIAPIQNKLGQLVSIPAIRQVLGQVRLRVNFAEVLQNGRILIVNLAKGRLGDDASRLLGALLTSTLSAAATERASLPAHERRDFVLVMDEAQNFLSDTLASILSESRKFGLGLVLSHQYLAQLPPPIQAGALGNAGTVFAFRVSGEDGERLALNFGSFAPTRFVELPPFAALVRPIDGAGYPFRLTIDPPEAEFTGNRNAIVSRSRQRHCAPRAEVEAKLHRWLHRDDRADVSRKHVDW